MADTQQEEVTEEQVKTANEKEMARWENDFPEEQLQVKYKAEDTEEPAKVETEEESTDSDDEDEVEYETPELDVTTPDPGQYVAADYSFEVTLKDGKTIKVGSPDEAEKIADDPDNFTTPKQLMDFLNKQNKMQRNLDRDHDQWQSKREKFDAEMNVATERAETISSIASEFKYLVSKNLLPPVAKEFQDADWSDPEVAKQPGVKEQVELLNYMAKENQRRQEAGVKPLASALDAHNSWLLDTERKERAKATREAGEARKVAGARVAGVSSSPVSGSNIPKGIAVGNKNVLKRNVAIWDN